MHEFVTDSLTVFMGFFAIMNPLANAPIFVGLTRELSVDARRRVAFRATVIAFIIVAIFSIGGHILFRMFGIGLAAFRVAGGILVFLVGKHLLEGQRTSPMHTPSTLMQKPGEAKVESAVDEGALAISPLAVPILSGPGTITCAISFAAGQPVSQVLVCLISFAALCVLTYMVFVGGDKILTKLGPYTLGVVGRLMGLILAVIGVQMIFHGLSGQFPELFR